MISSHINLVIPFMLQTDLYKDLPFSFLSLSFYFRHSHSVLGGSEVCSSSLRPGHDATVNMSASPQNPLLLKYALTYWTQPPDGNLLLNFGTDPRRATTPKVSGFVWLLTSQSRKKTVFASGELIVSLQPMLLGMAKQITAHPCMGSLYLLTVSSFSRSFTLATFSEAVLLCVSSW